MEVRLVQIGKSLGIILPDEALSKMKIGEGDVLHLTESPDGLRLTPYDPEFRQQMDHARAVMKERQAVLRELAS